MPVLALKLLLAPSFVLLATLAGRRFGTRAAGLVGGLPVVGGPILLVYALEHGRAFAASAATGTLLGLVSLVAFVVVYGRLARGLAPPASLLGGWAAFFALTFAFSSVPLPAPAALGVLAAVLALAPRLLPQVPPPRDGRGIPAWDLPLRAACAAALVLVLTATASALGSRVSGLLAPFPVLASVLAVFTHAQRGREALHGLLRGLLVGYGAFTLFAFTLAELLPSAGVALAFLASLAAALLCQGTVLAILTSSARRLEGSEIPPG
ncbi:MAG: hypothetical protein ACYCUM_09415 [Solirubrobacteraceae bacterium]